MSFVPSTSSTSSGSPTTGTGGTNFLRVVIVTLEGSGVTIQGGGDTDLRIRGAVRIPRTDIAVLRMDRPSPPKQLLRLSTHGAPWLAPTRTEGFGKSWHRKRERFGRVIARTRGSAKTASENANGIAPSTRGTPSAGGSGVG